MGVRLGWSGWNEGGRVGKWTAGLSGFWYSLMDKAYKAVNICSRDRHSMGSI
jgi:hypothetical protein